MRVAWMVMIVVLIAASSVARAAETETTPKDELMAAAKKLAALGNYGWTTTVGSEAGPAGTAEARLRMGPIEGKTSGGVTHLVMPRGTHTFEAAFKGKRSIIKTDLGWRPISDVAAQADDGQEAKPVVVIARMLRSFKSPASKVAELAQNIELMQSGETFSGELSEAQARPLLIVDGGGSRGTSLSGVKGKVTFWTKEGLLVRYEYTVQGTVEAGGSKRFLEQTTATSVKDLGSTRLALAPEARLKIP